MPLGCFLTNNLGNRADSTHSCALGNIFKGKLATISVCDKHSNNQMFLTALCSKQDLLIMANVGLFRAGLHSWANLLMCVWGWRSGFFDSLKTVLLSEKRREELKVLSSWASAKHLDCQVGNSLLVTHAASKREPPLFPSQFPTSSALWVLT